MSDRDFTILVVDDDENDLSMIKRVFEKMSNAPTIQLVGGGDEAIAYLRGEGIFGDRKKFRYPSLIVTDLKMPKVDGFEVLEYLQAHPLGRIIPTVVFSASEDFDDIKKSYLLGASSYHVKPNDPEAFQKQLALLYDYWLSCKVPQVDETGKQLITSSEGKIGKRFEQPN